MIAPLRKSKSGKVFEGENIDSILNYKTWEIARGAQE
jgi:hypothetical protein